MHRPLNDVVGIEKMNNDQEPDGMGFGYVQGQNDLIDTISSFQMDSELLAEIIFEENIRSFKECGVYPLEQELAQKIINRANEWIVKK